MTHEELDDWGPELQRQCNEEIAERYPTWSRYAKDRMLDDLMQFRAPNWTYIARSAIGGVPQIVLTQYLGEIDGLHS